MRYAPLLAIFGAAAVASCNCSTGVRTGCTLNSDCPSGQFCASGTCTPGGPDGGDSDGGGGGTQDSGPTCVNLECQQTGCYDGGTTIVTGTVYDPSGQVPLYNALVYVPNGTVEPFTPGVSCDVCGAFATGEPLVTALTGPDGTFTLTNVPAGANIPLVIQIGRWRRVVTLPQVNACTGNPITDVNLLRLPRSSAEGDIPQMAIATGTADPFECLLLKIGIADSEFTLPSGTGRIHYYVSNGVNLATPAPDASELWFDAGTLAKYDVVLLPCEGGEYRKDAGATQNIIDYTNAGGRVFTTHYGYVWIAYAQSPFPSTGNWQPDPNQYYNPPDPYDVLIDQSFPKGVAFAEWLYDVGASPAAGTMDLHESRRDMLSVTPPTQSWMLGKFVDDAGVLLDSVPHITFNTPINPPPLPDGGPGVQCGRVVFSDFHVTSDTALTDAGYFPASCQPGPLTPQEKALVFMLFDLSSCVQSDQTPPTICHGIGQGCSGSQGCCQGLVCLDALGEVCTAPDAGGCGCQPLIP
jgi:hypothetical protein